MVHFHFLGSRIVNSEVSSEEEADCIDIDSRTSSTIEGRLENVISGIASFEILKSFAIFFMYVLFDLIFFAELN
jgi:hypothetical protein